MAQLSEQDRAFLNEALSIWRRKDSFESALSRAVKNKGGSFEDYIRLISDLRDEARSGEKEIHEAARQLLGPEED
jgi:hypothetical protein